MRYVVIIQILVVDRFVLLWRLELLRGVAKHSRNIAMFVETRFIPPV